jgi:hypothetical protein
MSYYRIIGRAPVDDLPSVILNYKRFKRDATCALVTLTDIDEITQKDAAKDDPAVSKIKDLFVTEQDRRATAKSALFDVMPQQAIGAYFVSPLL